MHCRLTSGYGVSIDRAQTVGLPAGRLPHMCTVADLEWYEGFKAASSTDGAKTAGQHNAGLATGQLDNDI